MPLDITVVEMLGKSAGSADSLSPIVDYNKLSLSLSLSLSQLSVIDELLELAGGQEALGAL
jgi:hypothetical protein